MQRFGGAAMFTALANKLEVLTPTTGIEWSAFCHTSLQPAFAPATLSFLAALSRELLNDPGALAYPDMTALGFWLRDAHIKKLAVRYAGQELVGRGTVFHLVPGNVDTIFVYSLVLGLLAGNRNVVRLGKRETTLQKALLDLLINSLAAHPAISERVLIVRYGHDDEITGFFSDHCQVRVIWGGDATVKAIRSIPIPAGSSELAFAGRFSFAVIENAEFSEREIAGFVTDCFSFGQQGCSSPKLVLWLNTPEEKREAFWCAVAAEWRKRRFSITAAEAMSRWGDANDIAMLAQHPAVLRRSEDRTAFLRVQLQDWADLRRELNHGNGLFFELNTSSLEEVLAHCAESDQTIVTLGISSDRWRQAIRTTPPKGIARIVPAGQALEFAPVWDGHDIIVEMSRSILLT